MARVQANYTKNVGNEGKHNVSGSAGLELNSQRYDGFNITRRGYHRDRGNCSLLFPRLIRDIIINLWQVRMLWVLSRKI